MAGYNLLASFGCIPVPRSHAWAKSLEAKDSNCSRMCLWVFSLKLHPPRIKKTPMSLETRWGNKQSLFSSILLGEKQLKRRERFGSGPSTSPPLSVISFWGAISVAWLWMWWTAPPPEATPSRWRSSNAIHPWLHIAVSAIPESRPWRAPPWPTSAPRATQLTTAVTCRTSAGHCRVALQ